MRRAALGAVVLAAMALMPALQASEIYEYYRDEFNKVSYNENDGSLNWAGPWRELVENNGPSTGAVHISPDANCEDGSCLHIHSQLLELNSEGAKRFADTSEFVSAEICYGLSSTGLVTGGTLTVQVTKDGTSWQTIDTYALLTPAVHRQISINDYLSPSFGVRFVANGLTGGEFFIDNVEVKGTIEPEPTTTSTTKPSTTSTTKPTSTTSTTQPSTSTTRPTTTTTDPTTTSTTERETTTTTDGTTSTSVAIAPPPGGGGGNGPSSGLRDSATGMQADHQEHLFGDMDGDEVMGIELTADYRMAVEAIEASWAWLLALVILIAATVVSGLDRWRGKGLRPAS